MPITSSCDLCGDIKLIKTVDLKTNTLVCDDCVAKSGSVLVPNNSDAESKKEVSFRRQKFYRTWQEASDAAKALDIKSGKDYSANKAYKGDPGLPSRPDLFYSDFPGWPVFWRGKSDDLQAAVKVHESSCAGETKKSKTEFYETWHGAQCAVENLRKKMLVSDIQDDIDYRSFHHKDSRLPPKPEVFYDDFPGWDKFLGKVADDSEVCYPTWEEAKKATRVLKIFIVNEYSKKRGQDARLPENPELFYKDFPGWPVFLDRTHPWRYDTWQEARCALLERGFSPAGELSDNELSFRYNESFCVLDSKLPDNPHLFYPDFPGWTVFCERSYYETWQLAQQGLKKMRNDLGTMNDIDTIEQYKRSCTRNCMLHECPDEFYQNFPGWKIFLGEPKPATVSEWLEFLAETSFVSKKDGDDSEIDWSYDYEEGEEEGGGGADEGGE